MWLKEFMFLISHRVRSSSDPSGRTDTLASTRSVPFSISASEMPSSTIVCRRSCRNRFAPSRRGDVRGGADLDEGRAAAVVVDQRVVGAADPPRATTHVDVLRRILLEVRAHDPYGMLTIWQRYDHVAIYARRQIVLGYLIALREVGIEVVLPCEHRARRDLRDERGAEVPHPTRRRDGAA